MSTGSLGTLSVLLASNATKLTAGFTAASASAEGLTMSVVGLNTALKTTALISGAIFAGIGVISVKAFTSFDQKMTESASIMMDLTDDMRERMTSLAKDLAGKGPQSASQLAESFYFLASAGLSAEQQLKTLPVVQRFATAGAFDMARATDLLTDAQSALGLSVKDPTKNMENMVSLSDKLVRTATLANASVEGFSTALTSKAGPAMKVFNIDVSDGLAVLAAFADQGVKAELAGNTFSRGLKLLGKAVRKNEGEFKKLGISVYDSKGEFLPFGDIMSDMQSALGGLSTKARDSALELLGFETRTQDAILPLMALGERIKDYRTEIELAGGTTQKVSDTQMTSLANQFAILGNNLNVVLINLGEMITSVLGLNEGTKSLSQSIGDLGKYFERNMTGMTYWLKAYVLEFTTAFKITWTVFDTFIHNFAQMWVQGTENVTNVFNWITSNWSKLWDNLWLVVEAFAKDFGNLWNNMARAMRDFIMNPLEGIDLTKVISDLGSNMEKAFAKAKFSPLKLIDMSGDLKSYDDEIEKVLLAKEATLEDLYQKTVGKYDKVIKKGTKVTDKDKTKKLVEEQKSGIPMFASALQAGTAEAYRAELKATGGRDTEQAKIEENTKKTNEILEKVNRNIVHNQPKVITLSPAAAAAQ